MLNPIRNNIIFLNLGLVLLFIVGGCTSLSFVQPVHKKSSDSKNIAKEKKNALRPSSLNIKKEPIVIKKNNISNDSLKNSKLDFGDVFKDEKVIETASHKKCKVPTSTVRIELIHSSSKVKLSTSANFEVAYKGRGFNFSKSTFVITPISGTGKIRIKSKNQNFIAFMPCTLSAPGAQNTFTVLNKKYEGSLIIHRLNSSRISVINYLDVENYLRGVVPLELGRRDKSLIEAVKTQAVCARTYTYKKILNRRKQPYDLLPTVSDQVYGGVSVAYPVGDLAIKETAGEVILYKGEMIYAYYYSTCGGKTADIRDVWGKYGFPYLKSVSDLDENGNGYCGESNYYRWRESWSTSTFSYIVKKYSKKAFPDKPAIKGNVRSLSVPKTFPDGRVAICKVGTSSNVYEFGGDKIRFLFRRNMKGEPILRSSAFSVISADKKSIRIAGRGYGHGVGMCQFGTLGRAAAGQNYRDIIKKYYTDVEISKVSVK